MRRNVVAEVMNELCVYGGEVATRGQVYEDLQAHRGPSGERLDWLFIDRLVWMYPKYDPAKHGELMI
jgi:hypothetical protein